MMWTIHNKKEEKLLRTKLATFDFSKHSRQEIRDLVKRMREEMKTANGIGLSANQIGLNMRVFIAQPDKKFYAIFNPEIIKISEELGTMEEGCLSVPEVFGKVDRPAKITLAGYDMNGKKVKIKAWGLLARVFQHEMDHLKGIVFIDKARELHKYEIVDSQKNS
ncbi:MAG TPA: peptide deformylase [Candidatus Paceibacterota bacterium]